MENNNQGNNNQGKNITDTVNEIWNEVKEESQNVSEKVTEVLNDVRDESNNFSEAEIKNGKAMGILSYIIPLLPYIIEKENNFVKYHAKQGMNILILAIIGGAISGVGSMMPLIGWVAGIVGSLISLAITILDILGIVNVCNGKAKELPIVNKFQFIK